MTGAGSFAHLDAGSGGLISMLRHASAMGLSGVLELETPHGCGTITLVAGQILAASFHTRAGLPALTALSLLATGPVRMLPPSGDETNRVRDQFGLLTPVLLDVLASTTAKVWSTNLQIDKSSGTPIPAADTTTDQLLRHARLVVRQAAPTDNTPTGDFPSDFIAGLVSDELRSSEPLGDTRTEPPAWEPPPLGQMIGRCYLSALIGEGATAVVYRALHVSLKIDVAVKVFRPADDATQGSSTLSLHEAQILARLSHQNIVRVLDASDQEPWPHLVLEFVDGASLSELIAQTGRIPPETAIGMLLQVAEGLVHAHAAGVTHCDIKPGNILIDRQQVVKLTDLGVARATAGGPHHERKVAGTPAYIAPEVVQDGIGAATSASDIYSLGATGFHLVTGHLPYEDPDPLRMMVMHVQCIAPRASTRVLGLPHRLDALLARMLDRGPAVRPTATMLVKELRLLQAQAEGFGAQRGKRLPIQIYTTLGRAWRDLRATLDQVLNRR